MIIKRIVSLILMSIMAIFGPLSIMGQNTLRQIETINSVQQLDENIYLLDYKSDYDIDGLIEQGASSITDLLSFVTSHSVFDEEDFGIGIARGGGCSTFEAYTPDGDHTLARNFDFKTAPCFVLWTHPEGHYESISVIDTNFMLYGSSVNKFGKTNKLQALLAPYCCVDGINEKGLAIAVLQLKADATDQNDSSKNDITTTSMIRAVLDTCATVDEAVEFIEARNMHDSLFCNYHYQIIDASGKSVIVEYIDNKLYVYGESDEKYGVEGSVFEDDDIPYQYATNYSVTKDIGSFNIEQHGEDRAEAIVKVLKEKNGVLTELESMDLLSHVKLNYQHPKYPWRIEALWSSVYNSNKCTLTIAAGMDYSKVYTFSISEPCKVLKTDDVSSSAYPVTEWAYL